MKPLQRWRALSALNGLLSLALAWPGSSHASDFAQMNADSEAAAPIAAIFDPFLRDRGFVRKGLRWYRHGNDSIHVVDLQPSWPGPHVNFGIFYRRYGTATRPEITECQVWTRLSALAPDALRVDDLLAPATSIPDDARRNELLQLLAEHGLAWLQGMSKFEDARAFLAQQLNRPVYVAEEARAELE